MTAEFRWGVSPIGLAFPEGPTWFDGSLWVADVAGGGVHRLTASLEVAESFLLDRRGIGGLAVTLAGELVASGRDLVEVRSGTVVRPRPAFGTGLNDLGTDRDGALYVGVLTFRPTRQDVPTPGAVGRLADDGDDWRWWEGPTWPNGIAADADGSLIVADFSTGQLWQAGLPGGPRVVATSPTGHADGIAIDAVGQMWVATGPGASIECWSAAGDLVASHPIAADFVSSVCFGGPDLTHLYVTAVSAGVGVVLTAETEIPGEPVPCASLPLVPG